MSSAPCWIVAGCRFKDEGAAQPPCLTNLCIPTPPPSSSSCVSPHSPPCCWQVFRAVFDVAGWRSNCEAAAQGMRESVKTFRELLDHLSEVWMKVWESCGRKCGDIIWRCGALIVVGGNNSHAPAVLCIFAHITLPGYIGLVAWRLSQAHPLPHHLYIGTSDVADAESSPFSLSDI